MDVINRQYQNMKSKIVGIKWPPAYYKISDSTLNQLGMIRLRPFTKYNILYYYMPMQGLVSYSVLSVNVMNPRLIARIFPRTDITNMLLLCSFSGSAMWLWHRPHVQGTPPGKRFPWVFLGSSLYVLGSVLLWAIIRSAVGRRPIIATTLGLVTGAALTHSAMDYFYYLDKDIGFIEDVTEETIPSDEDKYDNDL